MSILRVGAVGWDDGTVNVASIVSYTVPVGASILVLDVQVGFSATNPPGTPTWMGSSTGMTLWGSVIRSNQTACHRYYLVNPTTGVGTAQVTGGSGGSRIALWARCYSGVDTTTPFRTPVTLSEFSASPLGPLVATSQVGDLVIDSVSLRFGSTLVADVSQVSDGVNQIGDTNGIGGVSEKPGAAGTTSMTWTYAGGTLDITGLASALIPASGGGGASIAAILSLM